MQKENPMEQNMLSPEIKNRFDKATIALERKNYNYAIELLTQAINIKPDFAKGREVLRLAEIKNFEENPPSVIMRIIRRILSFPLQFAAMASEIKGDRGAAIVIYEKILRKDINNVAVLVKLGGLLKRDGMKEASAITLEHVVKISKKNTIAYTLLGEIYSKLGKYERANFCFKKVLELKPHDADAEKGLKNISALTTIDKSFEKKDTGDFRIREITE